MTDVNPLLKKPANLLFVDDEPNVLKSLNRLFHSNDYSIFTAENGVAAIEVLKAHKIDLIISDMRMPQMDGAEFLAYAAEHWPDSIRILLTGFSDIASTIAAVNLGKIYNYCTKPWEETELKSLVNNALEQKWLREERAQLFDIINKQNLQLNELNASLEIKVEKRTEQLKKSLQVIEESHEVLNKHYAESIKAFARIIEMRPGIRSGHAKYIAEKAKEIAIQLNMEAKLLKDLVFAGLLLQIGKMSLPDALLTKALNAMNAEQKEAFLNHAHAGRDLLIGIEPLHNAAELISYQYEYYNGSGPLGLIGKDIPIGARILAVVRDYITYIDGSITGQPLTIEQVKQLLIAKRTFLYDPDVVDIFLDLPSGGRPIVEISYTQLQPGMEVAEVIGNDVLYIKDTVLTEKHVEDILNLHQHCRNLILRIRLGYDEKRE
jgi:response regulator RpfG family c-di-GMP phosphodiesterase